MEYKAQIYAEDIETGNLVLLDLFNDEKISVKSSVQNIQDIAKVFTDFSQSFTIPASKTNNDVFKYYYNNDLDEFNANVRVNARIEINYTPFREGKLQLESAEVKSGQVESYKITFFGDVVTLKDRFGEDKLRDLDFSNLSFAYSATEVKDSITNTPYQDVRFPLISSSRVWTYNDGVTSTDITYPNSSSAVNFDELFPAISDHKIMQLIEDTYGITLSGNFLTDDRLKNSYTWWKNRTLNNAGEPGFTTLGVDVTFNTSGTLLNANLPHNPVAYSEVSIEYVDMNTIPQPADWSAWIGQEWQEIKIYHYPISPITADWYYIDVYKNGALLTTFENYTTFGGELDTVLQALQNAQGTDDTYTFKIRGAVGGYDIGMDIKYKLIYKYLNTSGGISILEESIVETTNSTTLSTDLDFSAIAPDQKVADWFSGTLNEFNLTCYPLDDALTFQVEPLKIWYDSGNYVDITEWVNPDKINYSRAKLYNEISFTWSDSNSFMNEEFKETNNRAYGDLKNIFPNYDGGKYSVKLPFETLMFNNFDDINENLQVAYALTKAPDYKPYIPKPVKLYLNESKTCFFRFFDGTTIHSISSYMPFGQDTVYNNTDYTMNFGEEVSSLSLETEENSLYSTYYQPYLSNLFNPKTRIVSLETTLPIDILTGLNLNDAIIIRDKKYRINDMTTELTSGVVKLVLINDWEALPARFVTPSTPIPAGGGTLVFPIKPVKGGSISVASTGGTPFTTPSPTLPRTFTLEGTLSFTAPVNSTGLARSETYSVTAYRSDGSVLWTDYITITQTDSDDFLLTEDGGYLLTESLDKIKL